MIREPSRFRAKKKYSVDRSRGPLVLCAELIQKRLVQHCWPCTYVESEGGDYCEFQPLAGRRLGPDFIAALSVAVRVLAADTGARLWSSSTGLFLEGPHYIGADGYPKFGVPKKYRQKEIDMPLIIRPSGVVRDAIIHCAAVPTGWHVGLSAEAVVDIVRGWHKERGFSDIGYHYVIVPSGDYALGRDLELDGAHTFGYNRATLGIMLLETKRIDHVASFDSYYTTAQRLSLRRLLDRHSIVNVFGHNDYASKLCPGFKVDPKEWR